jgi:hypothetical protein
MRRSSVLAGIAVLLVVSLAATSARAFIRSSVDGDPSKPLFWRYRTVVMRPAYDTSDDVPADSIRLAIGRAMATWNLAADGCSDFRFEDGGYPSGLETSGFGGPRDSENRIVWHEDAWPEELSDQTLAVTTTLYRVSTGQILDADIDVNGIHFVWTDTTEPGAVETDVQNALTHELGHVLGLAHAPDLDATMYADSMLGDLEKRTLAQDDIDGLCFIYPARRLTPEAPVFHGQPLSGCRAAPGDRGAPLWLAPALAALSLRRRARSRARSAAR